MKNKTIKLIPFIISFISFWDIYFEMWKAWPKRPINRPTLVHSVKSSKIYQLNDPKLNKATDAPNEYVARHILPQFSTVDNQNFKNFMDKF